jgi:hypothetical protein
MEILEKISHHRGLDHSIITLSSYSHVELSSVTFVSLMFLSFPFQCYNSIIIFHPSPFSLTLFLFISLVLEP